MTQLAADLPGSTTLISGPAPNPAILPVATRAALAGRQDLGAGNFLWHALEVSPARYEPLLWLEKPWFDLDGKEHRRLSLAGLGVAATDLAGWYHAAGVKAKEVVA